MLTAESALRKDRAASTGLQHRHFAVIAQSIANLRGQIPVHHWEYVAHHMARELGGTNPRFDRARFLRACGVEQ